MTNCPHCETEVDEHEANRCLDAWVAEAVFDLSVERVRDGRMTEEFLTLKGFVPLYSTSIAAAWEVVERLRQKHILLPIWELATLDFFPLAICRAALKAVQELA